MDVFERRKMFKELAEGNPSKETVEKYRKLLGEKPAGENYGEPMEMTMEKASSGNITLVDAVCGDKKYTGQLIDAHYAENANRYFVAQSWIGGKSVNVEEAYRVFEETDKSMTVRRVKDLPELESIAVGLYNHVRKAIFGQDK